MKSAKYFERALAEGGAIGLQQAKVLALTDLRTSKKVWLGTDADSLPVAYFEVVSGPGADYSVSQVIRVQTVVVNDDDTGNELATIKVTCTDSRLRDVFFAFIDEVLALLSDDYGAFEAVTGRAEEWRRLLQIARGGLSETTATGLYGELKMLELACRSIGPKALGFWQKTPNEVHDFVGSFARLEVKTSSFQDKSSVSIHGLKQLEPIAGSTLTLGVVEVQKHNGETLDIVIDRLQALGINAEEFTSKLSDAGYVKGMPGAGNWKFEVVRTRFWEIVGSAPVLNRSALSDEIAHAVSNLSYSLSLGSLGHSDDDYDWGRLSEESN